MPQTPNLNIQHVQAASAQKHVAVNEGFRTLDALAQLTVIDKDVSVPPSSPNNGDTYIVGPNPNGLWDMQQNNIAYYGDNAWFFYVPKPGWLAVVNDENAVYRFTGTEWTEMNTADDSSVNPLGAATNLTTLSETINIVTTTPSFPITNIPTTIQFPNRAIILGVSVRVTAEIMGVPSFQCGRQENGTEYGSTLDVRAGTFNIGNIVPVPIYQPESAVITATSGHFTSGTILVSLHYISLTAPPA